MLAVRPAWTLWLLASAATLTFCGPDNSGPAGPASGSEPVATADPVDQSETGADPSGEPDRLALEVEFHRTRSAGSGFWVLGVVHNPHGHPVGDVRLRVRMLDAVDHVVGQTDAPLGRQLAPDERAAVAVLVPDPIVHEQLELGATALEADALTPEPLPLKLDHAPPERAELGGWYVVGTVENTGPAPFVGARIEIDGLDRSGKLLGIDWLELPVLEAGETFEFDVGDLRYEEPPAKLLLELRGPIVITRDGAGVEPASAPRSP